MASFSDHPELRSGDTGVLLVYPRVRPGAEPYAAALPALERAVAGLPVVVWVPIAVFAFLFGLPMDYEVFLLARIKEEHDGGHSTDEATVPGVARTGRLVTSAAVILFLAFVSLSRVPARR